MVALHGEFDKVTGTRLHNRLSHTANKLLNADKKLPEAQRRKFPQCMADALQHYTTRTRTGSDSNSDDASSNNAGCGHAQPSRSTDAEACANAGTADTGPGTATDSNGGDDAYRVADAVNASEGAGGGCFHCGAPAGMCQAHHITPYAKGGATSLDNLIMVCWNCHHKIHQHNWRIQKHLDGSHTLHPPDDPVTQPRHGPAYADDPPPEPTRTPTRVQKSGARTETRTRENRTRPNNTKGSRASRAETRGRNQGKARARDPALECPPPRGRRARDISHRPQHAAPPRLRLVWVADSAPAATMARCGPCTTAG